MNQIMEGVTEYAEGLDVRLSVTKGRLVVGAQNEGGHNGTDVDLVQLLEWVSKNMPELQTTHKWIDLTKGEMMEVANRANTYTEAVQMTAAVLREKNT
jgi:hypothetical protein